MCYIFKQLCLLSSCRIFAFYRSPIFLSFIYSILFGRSGSQRTAEGFTIITQKNNTQTSVFSLYFFFHILTKV